MTVYLLMLQELIGEQGARSRMWGNQSVKELKAKVNFESVVVFLYVCIVMIRDFLWHRKLLAVIIFGARGTREKEATFLFYALRYIYYSYNNKDKFKILLTEDVWTDGKWIKGLGWAGEWEQS